jgi:hypothetical protein
LFETGKDLWRELPSPRELEHWLSSCAKRDLRFAPPSCPLKQEPQREAGSLEFGMQHDTAVDLHRLVRPRFLQPDDRARGGNPGVKASARAVAE